MGCETMWLKVFKKRKRQKRYKALEREYHRFLAKRVCEICENHHEEIHEIYNQLIAQEVRKAGYRPTSAWTWTEAEALMKLLRRYCNSWLRKETPGLPLRKFAHTYRPRK